MLRRRALLAAAAAAAVAPRARAQRFADTLRVSWSDGLDELDPYHTPLRTGLALAEEIWDGLIWRDPDTLTMRPLLATAWGAPDDLSWEFTLRRGVWFHDGSAFGPEDVLWTVRRIHSDPLLAIPANYAWLAGAEQTGPDTVRLHLAHPFPSALDFIAAVLPILPSDAPPGSAIGTGPYRLDAMDAETGQITLARYEAYWGGSPKGNARIGRVVIRQTADPARPYNDLVSGRADWIWQLTPDEFDAIEQAPQLKALRADSMRVAYLALDAAGRSDPGGPLTRLAARQAACCAIDRGKLAGLGAPAGTRVIDTPCYPTQFGCDSAFATAYPLDRGRAHALLDAAGMPDGFNTTLVTYQRPEIARAMAHDLSKIGIRTLLRSEPPARAMRTAEDGRAPLFFGSWGSSTINDMAAFLPPFFDGGRLDMARRPALTALIARAGATPSADQERALYGEAIAEITGQALLLPLYVEAASYGIDRILSFKPTPDELPRFYRMHWR